MSTCNTEVTIRIPQKRGLFSKPLKTLTAEKNNRKVSWTVIIQNNAPQTDAALTFAVEFAAVNLVEKLHPHKCIENNRVVDRVQSFSFNLVATRDVKPLMALEQQQHDNNDLIGSLTQHVAPHSLGNHMVSSVHWWLLKQLIYRWFRRQSKTCQGIHQQVHPEKLNRS